jgi:choline dehydrogenase
MRDAETVIVGGGSAGCVVAARVSERASNSVLLLEAGPDYPELAQLPSDLADGGNNSMIAHDWGYRHRPTLRSRAFPFPRGRTMGGSSAVNTCIALRGQPADYDEWAARGLVEWGWEQCLPAFKRLERDLDVDDAWHGRNGELPIRRHPKEELCAWQAAFVEACRELGFADCYDSNAPNRHGVGPHAMNKVAGRRISASEAFLHAGVRARDNLRVQALTLVRRVLFENRRVVGVELLGPEGIRRLPTERVVLCAGAISTPAILLRSGIGPRDEVARIGCELVRDLPVGRRLLDHPGSAIFFRPRLFAATSRHDPVIQTALRYSSQGSTHPSDMLLQPGSCVPLPKLRLPLMSLMNMVGKPRTHGVMHFESADLHAKPRIDSRLLEDAHDRAIAVDALQLSFRIAQTKPMRAVGALLWPGPWVLKKRAALDAMIRSLCDSGYHPSGTAPMGLESDPIAVTDGHGRVLGVHGLTVADASLMPTIPSSNINLPTLMIGERIGTWLRDATDD